MHVHVCVYVCVYVCVCMHVCVCVFVYVYVCVWVCMCVYVCVHMCVCVYTCVYFCVCPSHTLLYGSIRGSQTGCVLPELGPSKCCLLTWNIVFIFLFRAAGTVPGTCESTVNADRSITRSARSRLSPSPTLKCVKTNGGT